MSARLDDTGAWIDDAGARVDDMSARLDDTSARIDNAQFSGAAGGAPSAHSIRPLRGGSGVLSDRRKRMLFALAGYFAVLCFYLPLVLLGQNAALPLLDWMDGDITGKVLLARNLTGISSYFAPTVPQMMQGTAVWANVPETLLYACFSPYTAYVLSCFCTLSAAYWGMLLFLGRVLRRFLSRPYPAICAVCAALFACAPYYLVQSLNAAGLPLLLWALLALWDGDSLLPAFLSVALYGACSTLSFTGYFVLGFLALFLFAALLRKQLRRARFLAGGFFLLTAEYILSNLPLFRGLLGLDGGGFVSHRTVFSVGTLAAGEVFPAFLQLLIHGQYHAGSKHAMILFFCPVLLCALLCVRRRLSPAQKKLTAFCVSLLGAAVFIAAFSAFCGTAFYQRCLQLLGPTLSSFQLDRLYFLYPALWYALLACTLALCLDVCADCSRGQLLRLARGGTAVLLLLCGGFLLRGHYETDNWRAVLTGTQRGLSWHQFFAEDTFAAIRADLTRANDGKEPCVVSLGLSPSIALYHGFDTLDGYSNNYALSYHKAFRKVIAGELAKDPVLDAYYSEWGNRCYLFCAALGNDFSGLYAPQSLPPLQNLAFDWDALRDMGCTHLLSRAPLADAQQYGLTPAGTYGGTAGAYSVFVYKM
ncbi:MAG: DUF6044 family protein [Ruthenibacterium sp.]